MDLYFHRTAIQTIYILSHLFTFMKTIEVDINIWKLINGCFHVFEYVGEYTICRRGNLVVYKD